MAQHFGTEFEQELVPATSIIGMEDDSPEEVREEDLVPASALIGSTPEDGSAEPRRSFRELMGLDLPEETVEETTTPEEVSPEAAEPAPESSNINTGPLRGSDQTGGETDLTVSEAFGTESVKDAAKFTLENVSTGLAGIADVFHWMTYSPISKAIDQSLLGRDFGDFGIVSDVTQQSIKDFYKSIGEPEEFQEAETVPGVVAQFALQNIGALGPIAGIRQLLRSFGSNTKVIKQMETTWADMPLTAKTELATGAKFFDNFLKREGAISGLGGVGAGAFWSTGNTEEQKDQLAALGNLVFSLSPVLAGLMPSSIALKTVRGLGRDIKSADDFWASHDTQIIKNLSRLVPEDQLPKLKSRMDEIRQIQTIVPDFRPSVGSVIGTNDARQIQSIIDADNFEAASAQYRTNKDAIESLVKSATESTDPAQREVVASALRLLRKEAVYEADRLRAQIGDIQATILERSQRGLDPDAVGQELKDQYRIALESYNEHIDEVFSAVDPGNKTRFDVEELKTIISAVTVKGGLGEQVNKSHKGYSFLTEELPAFLKGLQQKGAGTDSLRASLGVKVDPQSMSYKELYNLRKVLGKESAEIRNTQTGSRVPAKLDLIKKTIDDLITKKLTTGDPEVAARHFESIDMYRDMFIPRFRKGASEGLLRLDGKDIPNDKVASTLWNASKDDEVSNIKQLQAIFEESGLKIKDPGVFAAAKEEVFSLIEDFAVRDLGKKVRAATEEGKDTQQIFTRWLRDNDTKLKAFPSVQKEIDEIGKKISLDSTEMQQHLDSIEDLTNNVINKYSKVSPTELVQKLVGQTPMQVRETFRDLLVRNKLMADFDPEIADLRNLDEMINNIPHPTARAEALALRDAVSESVVQNLLRSSMRTDGGGFDSAKLLQALNGQDNYVKAESLNLLLNPRNRKEVDILRRGSKILGDELNPQSKIELDAITSFLNKFGVSAPSIAARIYAHQLGKVGPVFIIADTLQRTARGVSKLKAKEIYKKTMYDLDGLEKLVETRIAAGQGDIAALQHLQELSGGLKEVLFQTLKFAGDPKTYQDALKKALSASNVLSGQRLHLYLETLDEEPKEDDNGALDFYLRVNDTDTGQTSRVKPETAIDRILGNTSESGANKFSGVISGELVPVEDQPTTTNEDLMNKPLEELMQISDPVDAVRTAFSSAGLDENLGLIFAQIESSMDPGARPPVNKETGRRASSAGGLFQFIDGTWDEMVDTHGEKYGITLENADKFNPFQNAVLGAEFLKGNSKSLERSGFEATPSNLYAAHFLGAGGAKRLLKAHAANPNAPASKGATENQIEANPGIFLEGGELKTLQQVLDTFDSKIEEADQQIQSRVSTGASNV